MRDRLNTIIEVLLKAWSLDNAIPERPSTFNNYSRARVGCKMIPYYHLFSRFKKNCGIKVPQMKGAAKIKDAKFNDLYKNLYFSFPSARSMHTSRRVQISVQRMPLFLII